MIVFTSQFCFAQSQQKSTVQKQSSFSATETKVIDTISHLPEVKKRALYVEQQTKGKRHLQYIIWETPTKETPYYWVRAMEDNGESYHDHFDFYVYPKTFAIKYYDIANDIAIGLEQWRKTNKE